MKITFLGTGAADFMPSLADTDRFTVSRDIRRCTVTLLGEDIGMWAGTVFHAQTHLAEKPQNGWAYSFYLKVIAHSLTMLYNQNKSAHILLENRGI